MTGSTEQRATWHVVPGEVPMRVPQQTSPEAQSRTLMQLVAIVDPLDEELLIMFGPPGFTTGLGHGEKVRTHCVPVHV